MNPSNEPDWQATASQSCLTQLNEAILRMNESLDLDNVLQETLGGAIALTGAIHAVITLLDQSGEVHDCRCFDAAVDGMEPTGDAWEWTELLQHLGTIREPLRVPDLPAHIESLGMGQFRLQSALRPGAALMVAPMIRFNNFIGNIYVADTQDGGEFQAGDEEALLTFAGQAAVSIANAGRHLSVQRANAHLQSLLDTSPVGVVVFDAITGMPVSFNQEAITDA